MKTFAITSGFIIAWMVASMPASAQWNVIPRPPPPARPPAPGLRPQPPQRPAVVRPLEPKPPEKHPNMTWRRPDDRDVQRQIREREAHGGYSYDYSGRGVPPAGHYDFRGDGRGGRNDVILSEPPPPVTVRREVRYPQGAVVVATLNAGGEAKEVGVNREISRCYLELVSGTVSINTVVVRPEKTALPQTVRLQEGKLHMIDLGRKRTVTGFRISDNGRGTYRVIVQ